MRSGAASPSVVPLLPQARLWPQLHSLGAAASSGTLDSHTGRARTGAMGNLLSQRKAGPESMEDPGPTPARFSTTLVHSVSN